MDSTSGLMTAWLLGMGIVSWREVTKSHHMPIPGNLLGVSGLFLGLAVLADVVPQSRHAVTLLAFGLDLAGLLNILPAGLFNQFAAAQQAEASAEGLQPGGSTA